MIYYEGWRIEFFWGIQTGRMIADYENHRFYYSQLDYYRVIFNLMGVTDESVNMAILTAQKRVSDHIDYLCSKIYN